MIGEIYDESPSSTYRPSKEVAEFISVVKKDYAHGHNILTKSWNELNQQSVIEDMNRGRKMFNAFVDESYEDPNDAWKWRGTRSMARNKGIAMHANLTAAYLLPTFQAQNEDSDIDRGLSEFMTDLVEWMAQDDGSDYKSNFLSLVFAMESDPVVYLGAEYQEVMQEIKIKEEDGKLSKKEILDEVLSGFKAPIYTADQVLISNAFERNIQKHRFNITRRWIERQDAEAKYGDHEDWDCVKAGSSVVYNENDGLFYTISDPDHPFLVEEVTYKNRREDTEVCFLGGVCMGDTDVEKNPMKHRDNFDAPRYNLQQFGFYPIGSHFFFSKSMMASMRWDNALYDASTEILANRAILDAEMPIAITGVGEKEKFDGSVIFPNSITTIKSPDAKPFPLLPTSNLGNLITSLNLTEQSMSDASVNESMMGQLPPASQKAFTVAQAQANAKKVIGGVAKGLALSVSRYGLLMADIALNHLSVPQIEDIVGDSTKTKYRKFILENKEIGGQRMNKQLMFDDTLVGKEMTDDEIRQANLNLYKEAEENNVAVLRANPELFAKRKYYSRADFREVFSNNDEQMQAMLQGLYSMLNADPMIEREALLREMLYSFFHGKADKFIAKQPMMGLQGLPGQMPQGQPPVAGQANQRQLSTPLANAAVR